MYQKPGASRGDRATLEETLQIVGEMRHRVVSMIRREPQRLADDGVEVAGESRADAAPWLLARGGGSSICD